MKKTVLLTLLLATILIFAGCGRDAMKADAGEITFDFPDDMSEGLEVNMDPLILDAKLLDEDKNSIYVGFNIPFNSYIDSIYKHEDNKITVNLKIKPQMENKDPFQSLAPSEVQIVKIDRVYRDDFTAGGVSFAVQSGSVDRVVDYQSALLQACDYLDTDFVSTLNCLALYKKEDITTLSYIFFFGDTENINRTGNEIISGVIAVDALDGQMLEYRIFSRKNLPGTYRFAKGYSIEGWKDSTTLISTGTDGQEYFLMDMLGELQPLEEDRALGLINSYADRTSSMNGYTLFTETSENDLGFMYTSKAYVLEQSTKRKIPINLPDSVNIVSAKWDGRGRKLYLTTELAEPSYGNFWTYYTLWGVELADGSIQEIAKLPTGDFYINTDGSRLAYNGLEGDLFILDLSSLRYEDRTLK